jgi:adenylosuccinate synthase
MKKTIVIGAGFGDEGKGKITDSLCDENSIVVRFSGGQQAGHTVIHKGTKHIFSSYGAGTLRGCPTFLTEDTTFYLPSIFNEKNVLKSKGVESPELYIHPLAMVTTPYDIAYNRAKEAALGHGTCGLGVGATMNRSLKTGHKLFAIDFLNRRILEEKLDEIKQYYFKLSESEFSLNSVSRMEFLEAAKNQEEMFFDDIYEAKLPFQIRQLDEITKKNSNN